MTRSLTRQTVGRTRNGRRFIRQRLPRRLRRVPTPLAQLVVVVLFFIAWETLSGDPQKTATPLDEFFVGKPSGIWRNLMNWFQDGQLLSATWVTLQEAIIGFVIGSAWGVSWGFALGASRILASVFAPMLYLVYAVPRLALVPMFILWFGLGLESKIAMVSVLVFFLTFFNSYAGAQQVDGELIAVTRMMGASRWQVLLKVTLPSAVAWVSVGLQMSVPHAFTGAIVAEIVAGNKGLGHLITHSANLFNANGVFAGILVAVVIALGINSLVAYGTRYLLRWRTTDATAAT